ncbi:PREDICTED: low-specificity L-threonine aldolase [Prunus dulcis]|uniref:PREDICTED: low-specificity L-threonine aldolase n=1 Tax=Prunus dulcis TaxID=3755 RepID=A0A5E4G0H5_PRUDU|nr:PREDICTED: low-specificity L-threonine aldolase [Prunus dulcis]
MAAAEVHDDVKRYACQELLVLLLDLSLLPRRLRKTLGGGMRQVGILCAAALVALHENVANLDTDHKRAKILAEGLNQIKEIVETNIRALTGGHDENGNYTWDNTSSTLLCVSNMISSTFEHAIIESLPNLPWHGFGVLHHAKVIKYAVVVHIESKTRLEECMESASKAFGSSRQCMASRCAGHEEQMHASHVEQARIACRANARSVACGQALHQTWQGQAYVLGK